MSLRRGAGAADRRGLENRWARERPVGSNPTPAAYLSHPATEASRGGGVLVPRFSTGALTRRPLRNLPYRRRREHPDASALSVQPGCRRGASLRCRRSSSTEEARRPRVRSAPHFVAAACLSCASLDQRRLHTRRPTPHARRSTLRHYVVAPDNGDGRPTVASCSSPLSRIRSDCRSSRCSFASSRRATFSSSCVRCSQAR
jgi:hypothetical protein